LITEYQGKTKGGITVQEAKGQRRSAEVYEESGSGKEGGACRNSAASKGIVDAEETFMPTL